MLARILSLLLSAGLSVGLALAIGYGVWYVQSEGLFNGDEDTGETAAGPTPTSPATWGAGPEAATGQIWDDKWVAFSVKPNVCDGVLRFEGQAKNGASVSYRAGDTMPFVLYRKSALAPVPIPFSAKTIDPIAGWLVPLGPGFSYTDLDPAEIVATTLRTDPSGFTLVGDWPPWLKPRDTVLGVWGYLPG